MKIIVKKSLMVFLFVIYYSFFHLLIFGALVFKVYQPMPTDIHYDVSTFKTGSSDVQYAYLMEARRLSFDIRLALIEAAEETIDISYYAVHNDQSKNIFYGALLKAADRGVKIQFIIDGFIEGGVLSDAQAVHTLNAHPNITVRYYEPIKWFQIHHMQNRLHDKLIIVDTHYGIIGGRNIGDRYYSETTALANQTFDKDVLIFGVEPIQAVLDMQVYFEELFDSEFSFDTGTLSAEEALKIKLIDEYEVYIFDTDLVTIHEEMLDAAIEVEQITFLRSPLNRMHKEPVIFKALVELSKDYDTLYIQSPYFILNRPLSAIFSDFEIKNTTILTNSIHTNPNVLAVAGYLNIRNQLASEANLYEYQQPMSLHAKTFLFGEDITVIGSLNIDPRSAFLSTESVVIIYSEAFNLHTKSVMDAYITDSLRVLSDGTYQEGTIDATTSSQARKLILWILKPLGAFFDDLL